MAMEPTMSAIDLKDAAARLAGRPAGGVRCRLPPGTVLAREASKLFGEDWQASLSQLIDMPERMLTRIAEAAEVGDDYPGSSIALKRFSERLATLAATARKQALATQRRNALIY